MTARAAFGTLAPMGDAKKDPRKVATQRRSKATLEAVFEAMDVVVARDGVHAFSVAEVARQAGVGKASIYDYYPTRDALVAAWEERLIGKELERVGARVLQMLADPPSVEASVLELVLIVMDAFERQATTYGYKQLELTARTQWRNETTERIAAMMAAALDNAPHRARFRTTRLDVVGRLAVYSVLATARAVPLTARSADDKLLHGREMARMLCRYLLDDADDAVFDAASAGAP